MRAEQKFDSLYSGASGDDHSAADLELCNILAWWTNRDAAQMDRIFRKLGLIRDKWDKRHHSDGRTYGEGTIKPRSLAAQVDMIHGTESQHRRSKPTPKNRTCRGKMRATTTGSKISMELQDGYRPPSNDLPSTSP